MANDPKSIFITTAVCMCVVLLYISNDNTEKNRVQLDTFLRENGLSKYKSAVRKAGFSDQLRLASAVGGGGQQLLHSALLPDEVVNAVVELRERLTLLQWLAKQPRKIAVNADKLVKVVRSLDEVAQEPERVEGLLPSDVKELWEKAVSEIPSDTGQRQALKDRLWEKCLAEDRRSQWSWGGVVLLSTFVATVMVALFKMSHPVVSPDGFAAKCSFLEYVTGKYLVPHNCKVFFDWEEPKVVGDTMSFVVKFYQRNGRPYPVCNRDSILVEISHGSLKVASSVDVGSPDPNLANTLCVKFSVRKAGDYRICVMIGNGHVSGSPFIKRFISGPPEPSKTVFLHHCSIVVCSEGHSYPLYIEPRDEYSNLCTFPSDVDPAQGYRISLRQVEDGKEDVEISSSVAFVYDRESRRLQLPLNLNKEGCYRATVSFNGVTLKNGDFDVIVLNESDSAQVQKNVAKQNHNMYYKARLLSCNGEVLAKPKKVFCYLSPRQLTIREFILNFIPIRLFTFRVCPSTKFQFHGLAEGSEYPSLTVDDGCQPRVTLSTKEAYVLAAAFTHLLLKNIGGSETFKDKRDFFQHEVRKLHRKKYHDKLLIKVHRDKLLESSMKVTKGFTVNDWCRNFEVTFYGEQGLDWGGVRREWFECVCTSLFDADNGLFHSFQEGGQGLVHPNPKREPHLKTRHFEFAGRVVGKCLYESALGGSYRQLVKARFTRSFLAQLIGLRVHYRHLEQDDPSLYVSKVKYILENSVQDMDLVFAEEEYEAGRLVRVVELVPGGAKVKVTDSNKRHYLDCLAQHRLANTVREEMTAFLRGLNELIPDTLLSIFDENELELLMCGTGQFSVADFKANHVVGGSSYEFRKVLDWFWTAVSNFTDEEMARLLQFTTGCSQLPAGGFAELVPRFQITAAPTFGILPTAHTCFNQLCLPDYESYEQLEKSLLLAITEGSEGFGMI